MEWDRRAEVLRLRRHREGFSRLGWALTAQMAVMLAAQTLLLLLARFLAPGLAERGAFLWLVSALSAYGAGVPAFCLALRGTEAPPPRPGRPLGPGGFLRTYAAALGLMYAVNLGTLLLMGLIGLLRGQAVENPVDHMADYPAVLNLLLGCAIAPACEELLFRRLLLDRLRPWGEGFAMGASALCFGLFHGNLSQFFYACAIGLVLAGVALRTGRLWQAVLLHGLMNLVGVEVVPRLSALGETGERLLSVLVVGCMALGLAFLLPMARAFLARSGRAEPSGALAWRGFLRSPGVLCYLALSLALMVSSLL